MTGEQINKLVGYGFIGFGCFQLLIIALMALMMFFVLLGSLGDPDFPTAFVGVIMTLVVVFQVIFTVPSFVAAYGVMKKKDWARVASIVAAILAVMSMPFGTLIAILALWFFFSDSWKPVYGMQFPQFGPSFPPDPRMYQNDLFQTTQNEYADPPFRQPPDWR